MIWQTLFLHASEVIFDRFMAVKVLLESLLVQIRLERENFLGYLLVFTLYSFKLSLT